LPATEQNKKKLCYIGANFFCTQLPLHIFFCLLQHEVKLGARIFLRAIAAAYFFVYSNKRSNLVRAFLAQLPLNIFFLQHEAKLGARHFLRAIAAAYFFFFGSTATQGQSWPASCWGTSSCRGSTAGSHHQSQTSAYPGIHLKNKKKRIKPNFC
jgi:hypothetical protein